MPHRPVSPVFQALTEQRSEVDPGPSFVSVSVDSIPPGRSLLDSQGVPGPVVDLTSRRLVSLYKAGSVPRVFVVDEDGRIAYARTGVIENQSTVDSVLTVARAIGTPPPAESPMAGR